MKYLLSTDIVLFMQLLRKQINKGKTYYKIACRIRGNYWISQGILVALKCFQKSRKGGLFEWPSGFARKVFETASYQGRLSFGSASTVVRLLFENFPKRSRSVVEAESKHCGAIPERFSNKPRSCVKDHPTRGGTSPFSDFFLTIFAPSSTFLLPGRQFCSGCPSGLLGANPMLARCRPDENSINGRSWLGVGRALCRLFLAHKGTGDSRLSYWDCTEKVPKRHSECTKKLPKGYQIATGELQTTSSFLVKQGYKCCAIACNQAKVVNTEAVNRGESAYLKFDAFKVICGRVYSAVDSFMVKGVLRLQSDLKCFSVVAGYGSGYRMSLTCLFLILISMFSLSAQTPRKDSGAEGLSNVTPIGVDYRVPDDFWGQRLKVYSQGDTSLVTMTKFRGKPLIVDFWSISCASCISKFPKLQALQKEFYGNFNFMLVAQENSKQIHTMRNEFLRENRLPTVYNDKYLNTLFPHRAVPHYVWITPVGRIAAITSAEFVDHGRVKAFINYCLQYEMPN
ncbi:TlpA family protein disulfide reductase [Sphingobacterium sp. E70]|uniref:TlpA family protein disulfide reductase n=1 Tax=Sphingobacterium sp. E70 TaxID=2853439 RepID=UPI00211CCE9A|nr:TlpA disulfide reductase family protein [Sphingobacterium sp. E70]ULT26849.1 TlpA family protein disulfide reductase [Sphingobacterium sp. E70]